jgi:hypothetical protein
VEQVGSFAPVSTKSLHEAQTENRLRKRLKRSAIFRKRPVSITAASLCPRYRCGQWRRSDHTISYVNRPPCAFTPPLSGALVLTAPGLLRLPAYVLLSKECV